MTFRDFWLRARAVLMPRATERDLDDELSFHLERETRKMIENGLSPRAARAAAEKRFGSALRAADDCRDARGTAILDDLRRDVSYAFRTFKRAPLAASTIVCTLALGMGLVAVAFTILNALLFRTDAVPNVHEMYALTRAGASSEDRAPFTRDQFESLRRETRAFADAYAEISQVEGRVGEQPAWGTFVSGNFATVLGVPARLGRTILPTDDGPAAAGAVMMLSDRGWDRLFARDPAVVGRAVRVNGFTFTIVGVTPRDFRGLSVTPDDYWAPLWVLDRMRADTADGRGPARVDIVGRLRAGTSAEAARAELAAWDEGRTLGQSAARAPSNIVLRGRSGVVSLPQDALIVTAPLFFAFGLVLMIGCANVATLLLGRAVARQREMGVRLSLGAPRRRIVRQLLTESLLLALLASVIGFGISRVVLQAIIHAIVASMPPDLGDVRLWLPAADWRVLLFLVATAIVSTALFAVGPALHATRIDPVATLRGGGALGGRSGRTRQVLITLQVSASTMLLICSLIFLRSALVASAFAPGFRTADTVIIQIPNEAVRDSLVRSLGDEPVIAGLAASSPDGPRVTAETSVTKATAGLKGVSPEYFGVLDIPVTRGRGFSATERAPASAVGVVSETAARLLWPGQDALGQVLRLSPVNDRGESRSVSIVGVVRDVPGLRVAPLEKAMVYVPASSAERGTTLVARVRGDPERARQVLLDRVASIDAEMSRSVLTMRTLAGMEGYFLRMSFGLTIAIGGLALALTLSGLFSVLSYLVEQRRREIGVRMAVGATARDIAHLVITQSMRPVGLGLAVGAGLVGGVAALLLASPSAAPVAHVIRVFDPWAYAGSCGVVVLACLTAAAIPAARAARFDPTRTLRQD